MLAEVAQPDLCVEQRSSGLGDDDLPSVRSGRDPRRTVDVDPDVALLGHDRLACMDAYADADGTGFEQPARVVRGGDSVGSSAECDEERIALRVDLDTGVTRERIAENAPVFCQGAAVDVRSEFLQEPRRALDVCEEEGDGAGREVLPHEVIIRLHGSRVQGAARACLSKNPF